VTSSGSTRLDIWMVCSLQLNFSHRSSLLSFSPRRRKKEKRWTVKEIRLKGTSLEERERERGFARVGRRRWFAGRRVAVARGGKTKDGASVRGALPSTVSNMAAACVIPSRVREKWRVFRAPDGAIVRARARTVSSERFFRVARPGRRDGGGASSWRWSQCSVPRACPVPRRVRWVLARCLVLARAYARTRTCPSACRCRDIRHRVSPLCRPPRSRERLDSARHTVSSGSVTARLAGVRPVASTLFGGAPTVVRERESREREFREFPWPIYGHRETRPAAVDRRRRREKRAETKGLDRVNKRRWEVGGLPARSLRSEFHGSPPLVLDTRRLRRRDRGSRPRRSRCYATFCFPASMLSLSVHTIVIDKWILSRGSEFNRQRSRVFIDTRSGTFSISKSSASRRNASLFFFVMVH